MEFIFDRLRNIKFNHEEEIKLKLYPPLQQNSDIQFLNLFFEYGNLISIPNFTESLPNSVNLNILNFIDAYEQLSTNYAIYPLKDDNLKNYLNSLMTNFNSLWFWIGGSTPIEEQKCSWQHFSQAEGKPPIMYRLYNKLPYEKDEEIDEHIKIELKKFLHSHYDFIQYIRRHYPEVKLQ